ncbi:beta-galactosidase [Streptomyces meridianus]|uniref:Beta-galactosidase n=1 Tax=Streptomyces meridianus TaxID=2938945 RepID=A0ABT0X3Q2_9ACTN|nr:beta-galactosidase [Streptomyces meridianus]MCM2577153.1 beta-galactosidase [Streptomyces meridianus]
MSTSPADNPTPTTISGHLNDPEQPAGGVRLERRRLLVDGVPRVLMAGEVHYFRLHRRDWADRLDKLVAAGCTAVAGYMPWLVHETASGEVDLTGATSEYRDLVGFLELAAERNLLVIARPGPFVMAELKNEGIPFRIYREHPEALPLGWEGERGPTQTLDYLEPGYLAQCERWFAQIMPVLADHLVTRGGPVAAVQLDNEVGMLSWVTNTPELTDPTLDDLASWAVEQFGADGAQQRYGADPRDTPSWAAHWRSGGTRGGTEAQQLALHHDLGAHHRDRYARYLLRLREVSVQHGIRDVPFLINLHGTSEGRGRTFPIGISQLSKSYAGVPQTTSGSDHYIHELTVENVPDLYVMNAFMAAVHDADQPLTSLEFESGTGNYGEDLSREASPQATELKTRLCVAQGNRLISYYLFAGGHNPPLDEPVGDGNDRIAFTGERHGFAAPVDPEGRLSPTYPAVRNVVRAVHGAEHLLADMDEEHDDIVLGYVQDHYLTEYAHPDAARRRELVHEIERYRGMGPRDILARSLLLGGHSFASVDLSAAPTSAGADLDPDGPALALATPPVLGRAVQERLAAFLRGGGRLLLHGVLPVLDDDGTPCTVLADALGVAVTGTVDGTVHYFPSVRATDWAGPQPEVRVGVLQRLRATGATDAQPLAVDVTDGSPVALEVRTEDGGHAIVMACDYPCHLDFWRALVGRLGVQRRLVARGEAPGLVVTSTADAHGRRIVHLVNVAQVPQKFTLDVDGVPFAGGAQLELPVRSGRMLPLDIPLDGAVLRWATAEPDGAGDGSTILLRRDEGPGSALLETGREVLVDEGSGAEVSEAENGRRLVTWPGGEDGARLRIRLN